MTLLRDNILLVALDLFHAADHYRQGLPISVEVHVIGSLGTVLGIVALVLAITAAREIAARSSSTSTTAA